MRTRVYLLALLQSAIMLGCEIISPESTKIENQLSYVNSARQYVQALNRWWPWLAPPRTSKNIAVGHLDFELPATFNTAASTSSDFKNFNYVPDDFYCEATCQINWSENSKAAQELGFLQMNLQVSSDTHVDAGFIEFRKEFDSIWRVFIGRDATITEVVLHDPGLSPINHWQAQLKTTEITEVRFQFRKGISGEARIPIRNSATTNTINVNYAPWNESFIWPVHPSTGKIFADENMRRVVVAYANGTSSYGYTNLETGLWQYTNPGIDTSSAIQEANRWALEISYLSEQSLQKIETVIERTPATGPLESIRIVEQRYNRLGARNQLEVDGMMVDDTLRLQWQENDTLFGTVDIVPSEFGWTIYAFWDTIYGELIELDVNAYQLGFWTGTITGWDAVDVDQPTESGEWMMTPDGSFQADLLFKQVNDSIVSVPIISPPEGASRLAVDENIDN